MATALTARNKLLQEENDELYELLKSTETGRLKEEARGLKRAVTRLEVALKGVYLNGGYATTANPLAQTLTKSSSLCRESSF